MCFERVFGVRVSPNVLRMDTSKSHQIIRAQWEIDENEAVQSHNEPSAQLLLHHLESSKKYAGERPRTVCLEV